MSWFVDLAGKAEELLNRVDQSAAVVLKKDELDQDEPDHTLLHLQQQSNARSKSVAIVNLVPPTGPNASINQRLSNTAGGATVTSGSSINRVVTTAAEKSGQTAPAASPLAGRSKSRRQLEEEKLFEFLNSDGTPAADGRKQPAKMSDSVQRTSARLSTVTKGPTVTSSSAMSETVKAIASAPVNTQVTTPTSATNTSLRSSPTIGVTEGEPTSDAPRAPQPSQGTVSSVEYENRLLHNEVNSLNRELSQMLQRSKSTEAEMLNLRRQLEQRSQELSAGGQSLLSFQERENDLKQALDAKDSQLAVLRVRLQEADQELTVKRPLVESLQEERRRLQEDHSSSSGMHNQAIETVQERLRQTEETLEREQTNYRNAQAESFQRILKLENELKTISADYSEAQARLLTERSGGSELSAQLKTARHGMECAQQELSDYKVKAQRILQSKERLIASLKQSNGPSSSMSSGANGEFPHSIVSAVELEELRQERDLLKDEVSHANQQLANLRADMQEGEAQLQEEIDASREQSRALGEQLREAEQRVRELELEAGQSREELRYLREDASRQRANLQSRLLDRDEEIERLRRQLIAKQVNTTSYAELEARLNALTESLIHKQTLLEALATEKSSLVFQLERMEQRANETSTPSRRASSLAVNVSEDCETKQRVPSFMVENVFDSQVTRKVKRVYNTIDSLSIRFGVFLRRYPMARTLILVYMAMLHLWVMVVLFTYTPEMHGQGAEPSGK